MLRVYGYVSQFGSVSLLSVYVCAYAFKFKVHCGIGFEPGASILLHTTSVRFDVIGALAVSRKYMKPKKLVTSKFDRTSIHVACLRMCALLYL